MPTKNRLLRLLIVILTTFFCNAQQKIEDYEVEGSGDDYVYQPPKGHKSPGSTFPGCLLAVTELFPHPFDNNKFLKCYHGRALVQKCFPGAVFIPKIKQCDCTQNLSTNYYETIDSSSSEDSGSIYDENLAITNSRIKKIFPPSCGVEVGIFTESDDTNFEVVRGTVAKKGMHPWQVSILEKTQNDRGLLCGAVIVSKKFVLTAAHCCTSFNKKSKRKYIIVAGDYDRDEDEGTEQYARIERWYIHEDYKKGTEMNNDIALIKLKGAGFYLGGHVRAICLPNFNFREEGANCTISGFGRVHPDIKGESKLLRAGFVRIHNRDVCSEEHIYGERFTKGMVCASPLKGEPDTCKGDSGGPLACLSDGLFTLAGLTSWGESCNEPNKPGVYVKVAYYKCWIEQIMIKYS